jgi:YYY domain-containing protein
MGYTYAVNWFWFSTRAIGNTITEYPLFSFIWGDVHPHVIALMNQVFYLFILSFALKNWGNLDKLGRWIIALIAALSLGTIPVINTWDVFIYAPITIMFLILIWDEYRPDMKPLIAIPVLGMMAYAPFVLMAQMHNTKGFMPIFPSMTSDPFWFLLITGFFIAAFIAFTIKDMIRDPKYLIIPAIIFIIGYQAAAIAAAPFIYMILKNNKKDIPALFGIIGLLILIFCEMVYIKDGSMDKYFRLNTVFKFYMMAWILMGISSMHILAMGIRNKKFISNDDAIFKAIMGLVVVLLCVGFAIGGYYKTEITGFSAVGQVSPVSVAYDYFDPYNILNISSSVENSLPGITSALVYLSTVDKNAVMVESTGDDFSLNSTLSTFSGVPSVIGMPYHEYLWRGGDQNIYVNRYEDVHKLYDNPSMAIPIMKKYNATLVVVSSKENIWYNTTLNETNSGLRKVFQDPGVSIYGI